MKIVFLSNFLNHHQLPLCEELVKLTDGNFTFIAEEPIPNERVELGYNDMNQYPFVIRTYESEDELEKARKILYECDVAIIGDYTQDLKNKRLEEDKLSFYYMERLFKYGYFYRAHLKCFTYLAPYFIPLAKENEIYDSFRRYRKNKNLYLLSASNYVAGDLALCGMFWGKAFKWGYFPKVIEYDEKELYSFKKNDEINILWTGRFLDWKHPDDALEIAKRLKYNGYKFHLDFIGTGEMQDLLKDKIKEYNLHNEVSLLGSMSPEEVRRYMEKANIFLFTSDYNEGWGAVLNEAMNSGCAVVASKQAGATGFLVKDKYNGLTYNGRRNSLYKKVEVLIRDEALRNKISQNAYQTIKNEWNASVAAKKFIDLCQNIMENKKEFSKSGICSKAKRVYKGFIYTI